MEIRNIKIDQIKIENRLWEINEKRIQPLAESIEKVGLMNPITVLESDGEYILIAGEHRINAYKYLKWDTIPCHVYQREFKDIEKDKAKCVIMEVDENLMRKIRDVYEESYLLYQRKEAYEKLYPSSTKEAKQSMAGSNNGKGMVNNGIASPKMVEPENVKTFVQDTAEKLNVSETNIKRKLRRGEILNSELSEKINELGLKPNAIDLMIIGDNEEAKKAVATHIESLEFIKDNSYSDINCQKLFMDTYKELKIEKESEEYNYQVNNPVAFAKELRVKLNEKALEEQRNAKKDEAPLLFTGNIFYCTSTTLKQCKDFATRFIKLYVSDSSKFEKTFNIIKKFSHDEKIAVEFANNNLFIDYFNKYNK